MDSKITATGFIIMGNIAAELVSFISSIIIMHCVLHGLIHAFQDLYAFIRVLFQFSSKILRHVTNKTNVELNDSSTLPNCPTSENHDNDISVEGIKIVMENLGISYDDDKQCRTEDVVNIFHDREPCLDEVREAFSIFDDNNDGFIDAEELRKVLNSIGLMGFCEEDCQRMIVAFDINSDGKIDLGEFAKLVEECLYSCTDLKWCEETGVTT